MIKLRQVLFRAEAMPLCVFSSSLAFLKHAYKHILDVEEGSAWALVLDFETLHWQAMDAKELRHEAQRALNAMPAAQLQLAYNEVFDLIEQGIDHAETKPSYLMIEYRFVQQAALPSKHSRAFRFLSEDGIVILARNGFVRTCFFPVGPFNAPSKRALWQRAADHLHALGMNAKRRELINIEDEPRPAIPCSVEWRDKESFEPRANPWRPEPASRPPRRGPRRSIPETEGWSLLNDAMARELQALEQE